MTECCKSHSKVKLCCDYLTFMTFFQPLYPDPDFESGSRIRIRIQRTPESGSNRDPDPKHWTVQYRPILIANPN